MHANFLRASLENSGLDPDDPQGEGLGQEDFSRMSSTSAASRTADVAPPCSRGRQGSPQVVRSSTDPSPRAAAAAAAERKAWKDVWSAGHGTMVLHDIPPVADLIKRMRAEYDQAANTPKF